MAAPKSKPRPIAAELGRRVTAVNRWRDTLNPLRSLTIPRVVSLHEAFDRGEMADIQWTFRAIERSDADLIALIERRNASLLEMDFDIRLVSKKRGDFDPALAEDQAACLREAYDRIANLYGLIEHLAGGVFRGYAVAARPDWSAPGPVTVTCVDPWNIVRDGSQGAWKYNPEAWQTTFAGLPEANLLAPEEIIVLTHARPIDHWALPKFCRTGMGEKDWTAFVEIYGIPSGIVIMPSEVPQGQEAEFSAAAEKAASGTPAALPFGSDYKPNDQPRGTNPFKDFLDYFTQKLVLVGTGGRLTMLTEAGSGTLAGGAHADTFRQIARAHARKINEALQRQVDADLLAAAFPGRPALAYFALDFQAEVDTGEIIDHALKLTQAGYRMDPAELSEKTGYAVTAAPQGGAGVLPASPFGLDSLAPVDELASIRNRLVQIRNSVA